MKELKKLQGKDTKSLEKEVANLKVELALWKDEIKELKVKTRCLERIKEVVGTLGDVLNKAHLFNKDIKTEGEVFAAKIVKVLVTFTRKMEAALVDIWKIVSGLSAGESSRPSMPPLIETLRKEKPLEEIKTPRPQRLGKETIAEGSGEVPPIGFTAAKLLDPAVIPALKKKKSESSEPSPWKQKKKEHTPEYEELDESMEGTGSSEGGMESEDEKVLATPPAEKKRSMNTRSSGKKEPLPVYKTPLASKRQAKISPNEESSQKKPKGK